MEYTLYILYDEERDKFYIGQTQNLEDRLERHFGKRSKYTKTGSWKLAYKETFDARSKAILREKYLKSLKSKDKIKAMVGYLPT